MTACRALPRTLVPLKDESLTGYLLRLSHRLEFSPFELGQVLGLSSGDSWSAGLPGRLILEIPADRAKRFAQRAQLTAAEVDALTYRPDAAVYPAVDVAPYATVTIWTQRVLRFGPWLRNASTRYCPRCLAGDGSTIQARHGGAWSKYWRFAPVFACVEHGRLLDYLCPVCAQPALTRNPAYFSQLIPLSAVAGRHPAACRAPTEGLRACAGRFDEPAGTAPEGVDPTILQPLLSLQTRFNALLATHNPQQLVATSCGRPVTAAQYFADLQVMGNILATVMLGPSSAHPVQLPVPDLDGLSTELRAFAADPGRRAVDPLLLDRTFGRFGDQTAIPLDSAACGCLLALADGLLNTPDTCGAADRLEFLFGHVNLSGCQPNIARWTRPEVATSPGLKSALGEARQAAVKVFPTPNAPTLRPSRRWHDLRLALIGGVNTVPNFGADCIPQRLPESWWARHFEYQGSARNAHQRLAVITLATIAEDCSIPQAMRRLHLGGYGFSLETVEAAAAMGGNEATRFAASMSAMIDDLNSQETLTDYDRRRQAMERWRLDDATWEHLADGIRYQALPQTTWNDEKRMLCAVYIWRQVTEGEHLRAPMLCRPFASRTGRDANRQYVRRTWRTFSRVRPNSYLHALVARMDECARSLILHIDSETIVPARSRTES